MVSSPEVSRRNGAKSKGPKTKRGKAIASQNATKHGLLSQKPPVLATEDLETFQGLMQGLIDHYEPQNPIEHLLVQKIGMAMQRQYRLWAAETAITNQEIFRAQKHAEFPDYVEPSTVQTGFELYTEQRFCRRDVLNEEKDNLADLIFSLELDLSKVKGKKEWDVLVELGGTLRRNRFYKDPSASFWQHHNDLDEQFPDQYTEPGDFPTIALSDAIPKLKQLIELARQRIAEIDQRLERYAQLEDAIRQAGVGMQGIQDSELLNRYQAQIDKQLYEAIDKLTELRATEE